MPGRARASVSVWRNGREIVSLAGGWREREQTHAWDVKTLALIYSGTKGPAAACVLKCLSDAGIALHEPVASVWPRFALARKESITFAEVLSHRAGLPAVDDPPSVFDYDGVIRRVEEQAPLWTPGDAHGYHPRMCGYLWDEIVRRVTGEPLGRYWRQWFAEPLEPDFWIGLPADRLPDAATMYATRMTPAQDAFHEAFTQPGSITHRAFSCPVGLFTVSAMNTPAARMTSFPAFGGIGSASALAKFYAMLACGGEQDGVRVIAAEAVEAMSRRIAHGFDCVLRMETAFSAGLMQDPTSEAGKKTRFTFGPSPRSFGHPGAGGASGSRTPTWGWASPM